MYEIGSASVLSKLSGNSPIPDDIVSRCLIVISPTLGSVITPRYSGREVDHFIVQRAYEPLLEGDANQRRRDALRHRLHILQPVLRSIGVILFKH